MVCERWDCEFWDRWRVFAFRGVMLRDVIGLTFS